MTELARNFTCPHCGRVSHNPNDLEQRYCGFCHRFVDDDLSATAAYVNGYAANKLGEPVTANPHRSDTRAHLAWLNGFGDSAAGIDPNIGGPQAVQKVRPQ